MIHHYKKLVIFTLAISLVAFSVTSSALAASETAAFKAAQDELVKTVRDSMGSIPGDSGSRFFVEVPAKHLMFLMPQAYTYNEKDTPLVSFCKKFGLYFGNLDVFNPYTGNSATITPLGRISIIFLGFRSLLAMINAVFFLYELFAYN